MTSTEPPRRPALPVIALAGLLAVTLLAACDRSKPPPPAESNPGGAEPSADRAEPGSTRIKVLTPDNQLVVTFRPQRDQVTVEYPEAGKEILLQGKLDGKVRRYTKDGSPFAEARTVGVMTTITDAAGHPLWVIKVAGKRFRIGKSEGDPHPYLIAKPDPARLRVALGDEELGKVTYDEAHSRAKIREKGGKVLYDSVAPRLTAMYGGMLLPDFPADQRFVIMGELLLLGY